MQAQTTADPDIPARLAAFARAERLLRGVRRLGAAVSGGPDSVALLLLLAPLCRREGIALTVLHLNHGLPGPAAEDTPLVRALAARLGLPLRARRARVPPRARDGLSVEMRARAERQRFFARAAAELRLDAIATGHQADDLAETFLLRLRRGAGLAGLSALRPRSPAPAGSFDIIRPLLPFSKAELRAWLRAQREPWHDDASNLDLTVPRNVVRHRLMPCLRRLWGPSVLRAFARTSEILRADDSCLDALARRAYARCFPAGAPRPAAFRRLPLALQRRVLRLWLFATRQASGFDQVERLRRTLISCGGNLRAAPRPRATFRLIESPAARIVTVSSGIGRCPAVCTIDPAALGGKPLSIRTRRPGDKMAPLGLGGHKKLQDIFTDAKIPRAERDSVPIVVCGDAIVWLPGYRIDRRFAVPAGKKRGLLRLTLKAASPAPSRAKP